MDDGDDDDTDDDDTDDDTDDDHDDDDTDDDNDHKNDSYTAAGAAPGASVPCPLSRLPASWDLGLRLKLEKFVYLKSGSALSCALNACGAETKNNNLHFSIFWRGAWKSKSS